ncbi:hypothetical protein SVAN01_05209 [Stagonosporopsis vannaccii]|nr:hypothetical protein SVAN01_05209 [Stagonosporopsis vannaccii]
MQLIKTVLVGLGLVALALSTPTSADGATFTSGPPATTWQGTHMQRYHCVGKDVIQCETAAGGRCLAIDPCKLSCFERDKSALCISNGEFNDNKKSIPGGPVPMADLKIAARKASPHENKHCICSKDRRGVLICKYGFCSTDQYCKSNEECKDESVSCESKSPSAQASKSEIRAVADLSGAGLVKLSTRNCRPKEKSSYVCSKDCASILKCNRGFCAINY